GKVAPAALSLVWADDESVSNSSANNGESFLNLKSLLKSSSITAIRKLGELKDDEPRVNSSQNSSNLCACSICENNLDYGIASALPETSENNHENCTTKTHIRDGNSSTDRMRAG